MPLLNAIEEQCLFGFSGKINVLQESNKQFKGAVYLKDGLVVNASWGGQYGLDSLYQILSDDISSHDSSLAGAILSYIVEPEMIEVHRVLFELDYDEVYHRFQQKLKERLTVTRLRPPSDLVFTVNREFVTHGPALTASEFDILCTISDVADVDKIYEKSAYNELETTRALVSLRRKNAFFVSEASA